MKSRLPLLLSGTLLLAFAGCQSTDEAEVTPANVARAPAPENLNRPAEAENVARAPAKQPLATTTTPATVPDPQNRIQLMRGTELHIVTRAEDRSTDAQWAVFFRENAAAVLENDFPMDIQFSEGEREMERGRTALVLNVLEWSDNGNEAVCRIEAELADGTRSESLGTYTGVKSIDNGPSASRESRDDAARDALSKLRADLLALMRAPME